VRGWPQVSSLLVWLNTPRFDPPSHDGTDVWKWEYGCEDPECPDCQDDIRCERAEVLWKARHG
jgi:hypothetical protein